MQVAHVNTKEELKKAIKHQANEIIITGDLASKIHKSRAIGRLSGWKRKAFFASLATVAAAIALVPLTGGTSAPVSGVSYAFATSTAAGLSGLEIATILTVAFLGTGMLIALFKEYDEVSYGEGQLTLKRKSKKS